MFLWLHCPDGITPLAGRKSYPEGVNNTTMGASVARGQAIMVIDCMIVSYQFASSDGYRFP